MKPIEFERVIMTVKLFFMPCIIAQIFLLSKNLYGILKTFKQFKVPQAENSCSKNGYFIK